jgi:dolichol-phosphate mannosyltransferase
MISVLLRTIAIIPVYRDRGTIFTVLSGFREKVVDEICIVIDQGTEREFGDIRKASSGIRIPVYVIKNEKRMGVGYALRQGINYALRMGYDIAVVMAGNNKDNPAEIPRLLSAILNEGYDYVQGSRFLAGGSRVRNPHLRGLFSRLYPFFWTWLTKVRCTDVTNGFRAYKLGILSDKRINISQDWLDSYELEYYIHYKAITLGYRTKEVPVSKTYMYRNKGGYSNISPFRDWWKIVKPLVYLKLRIKD